ncbi:MAG: hypothetical protein GC179_05950 [Anaerolineaceae bacterium]|nr:hypothetical protein [Anaerolineaceae bacterium]
MQESIHKLEPLYPDVLGSITGGARISMDKLQCALGIFPTQTYMNQPVEVILILQNMVDQPMQIKVGLQLPSQDKKGHPVVIDTAQKTLAVSMRPGEVGVLRIPIIPLPPTQAGTGFPVRVAVRYRTPNEGHPVRPPAGGAPPSVLSISSFKLQALREVAFSAHTWNESAEIITTYFDIAPKRTPPIGQDLQPKYESLWTMQEMVEERELVQAKLEDAQRVATSLTRNTVYVPMMMAVEEHFAERGMPLHPGEMRAIAKMMTYTLDEGLELEPGFSMEDSRWFLTLCQVLAHNPDLENIDRGELVTKYLFEAALYDSILLGFSTIDPKVKEDLGDAAERVNYANRVLAWFAGEGDPDPSYIYLPLAMGGVVVNMLVASKDENPWLVVDQLTEANRGRARLASGEVATIFKVMDSLLNQAEDALRRARVNRP